MHLLSAGSQVGMVASWQCLRRVHAPQWAQSWEPSGRCMMGLMSDGLDVLQLRHYFPGGIYDTKHLATSGRVPPGLFERTSLGDVFERLTSPGVCRLFMPGDEEPSYTLRLISGTPLLL